MNIQSDNLEPQQFEVVEGPQFESELQGREEMDNMDSMVAQTDTDHEDVNRPREQSSERVEDLIMKESVE